MEKQDITTLDDIKLMVDSFYDKVKQNQLIGPIFIGAIRDNWPAHLEKMYRFWQTVLLEENTYSGSPFAPHADMPLREEHFKAWLDLFTETVDENFSGSMANEAKSRAGKMAEMFQHKINFLRGSSASHLR